MLVMKQEKAVTEKELVLGDYVTVQVSAVKSNQIPMGEPRGALSQHEELFQRSLKLRGELTAKSDPALNKRNNVIYRGTTQHATVKQTDLQRNTG